MRQNFTLYLTLAKISCLCFGGGYAILPHLRRSLVQRRQWLTEEELGDIFSIAQVTPGVIAVNASTYVGAKLGGFWGALCATLGVLTPPIVITTLVAAFFWPYFLSGWVRHAIAGLQVCVCALLVQTVVGMFRRAVLDLPGFLLFLAALGLSCFAGVSPALLVVAGGLCGLAVCRVKARRQDS